jgi:hypothetical protein
VIRVVWSPVDFDQTAQAAISEADRLNAITADMRAAAEILDRLNREYEYHPDFGAWSPDGLRKEAVYLDRCAERES